MLQDRSRAGLAAPFLSLLLFFTIASGAHGVESGQEGQPISIVVGPRASRLEHLASEKLAGFLEAIYPKQQFLLSRELPAQGRAVLLGTVAGASPLRRYVEQNELTAGGSFVVKTAKEDGRQIGIIAGADPRATLHAVYALAERLGYGFYISGDAVQAAPDEPFDFQRWELADRPLFDERIVLNWHNFLSSCSTWDLPEWQHWIRQVAKMRYTSVMVHAYGNNPMVCFTHNGQAKPVGYLTTTAKGRDWGTQHVNDVRLLHGAEGIFDGPVFGSKAAMVPDDQRVEAARQLMRQVFAYAEEQGLDVVFALDVDTISSNPPNIIKTLPASARFTSAGHPLANPDTPEGLAYYRSQIESLFGDYPQIDRLVVWFRTGRTLWRRLTPEDFPEPWKTEYREAVAGRPEIAKHADSPSMFAIGKIVCAFRKLLDETGREDVKLGTGTWGFGHMAAADAFLPREVALLALDYRIRFDTPEIQRQIKAVSLNRPMIPIVWAHHDDRTYIGRPCRPFDNFASQLNDCRTAGFGIIHWTTRPLDLYFKSLSEQTWKRTRDLPLEGSCRQMAGRLFGPQCRDALSDYLFEWVTTAPRFGRETTDRFIDRPLENPDEVIAQCRKRLVLIEAVNAPSLDPTARKQLDYFKLLEQFFVEFYRNETTLQKSIALLSRSDLGGARKAIKACKPEAVIKLYARAANQCGISLGEKALIISMNLRWLPYFEAQRQAVGLSPVRINFQPTGHDPLAQGAGHRTFYVDRKQHLWLGLGEKETGVPARTLPQMFRYPIAGEELICGTCIESDQPIRLGLRNIIGGRLAPGTYAVDIWFCKLASEVSKTAAFSLLLRGSKSKDPVTDAVDLVERGKAGSQLVRLSYTLQIDQGHLEIEIKPVRQKALLCGMILRCIQLDKPKPGPKKPKTTDLAK